MNKKAKKQFFFLIYNESFHTFLSKKHKKESSRNA